MAALRAEAARVALDKTAQLNALEKARLDGEEKAAHEAALQAKKQAAAEAKAARIKAQEALCAERYARSMGDRHGCAKPKPYVVAVQPEMVSAIQPENNQDPPDVLLGSKKPR